MTDPQVTDINSPQVQAIFAQLHALGVTPEQAAAGVRILQGGYEHPFQCGDFATLRGLSQKYPKGRSGHLGQRVEVLDTDYNSGDGLEVLIEAEKVGSANGRRFWVGHDTLKRTEPTA